MAKSKTKFFEIIVSQARQNFEVDIVLREHLRVLAEAKSFLGWCVGKRWVARNPLEGVNGVGRRRHGKAQLRIDEARRWQAKALEFADQGEAGAVAAMMAPRDGRRRLA